MFLDAGRVNTARAGLFNRPFSVLNLLVFHFAGLVVDAVQTAVLYALCVVRFEYMLCWVSLIFCLWFSLLINTQTWLARDLILQDLMKSS